MRLTPKKLWCLLLLLLFMATGTDVYAQYTYRFTDSLGTYKVIFKPHNEDNNPRLVGKPLQANTNELRIGVGFISSLPNGDYTTDPQWYPSFENDHNADSFIWSPSWVSVGVEFGRWLKDWLYVGGVAVWTGGFAKEVYSANFHRFNTYNYNALSLMPEVRFAWLRRGVIQLYSGLGLGVGGSVYEYPGCDVQMRAGVSYDVTFFGLSVGRKWFGYFDISAGNRGVFTFGIGYRFNNNDK